MYSIIILMVRIMNIEKICDESVLDLESPTPLYHQIYMILKAKIEEGDMPRDCVLPGEHALAEAFNVSRITAKRALNELARSGYVLRYRGRGTCVIYGSVQKTVSVSLNELIEKGFPLAEDERIEFIDNKVMQASKSLSASIGLKQDEKVSRKTGIFYKGEEAFAVVYVYGLDEENKNGTQQVCFSEIFSDKTALTQTFRVKSAENECLKYLDLPHGAMIADIELMNKPTSDHSIKLIKICGKPQYFQYHC